MFENKSKLYLQSNLDVNTEELYLRTQNAKMRKKQGPSQVERRGLKLAFANIVLSDANSNSVCRSCCIELLYDIVLRMSLLFFAEQNETMFEMVHLKTLQKVTFNDVIQSSSGRQPKNSVKRLEIDLKLLKIIIRFEERN